MISRTRLIITTLTACHLFLRPGLLTSQLPPPAVPEISRQTTQSPAPSGSASIPSVVTENKSLDGSQATTPTTASPPKIDVITDSGQPDRKTEQIIEQELQTGSDQELGPPRPAINVPLGRTEVLIRADEQEKIQDIYKARGHVEIRFHLHPALR